MKTIGMTRMTLLLSLCLIACLGDPIEGPKSCTVCSMNRTLFASSRMQIVYSDGTKTGVCSLHCAAEVLRRSVGRPVARLLVADYTTKELIDAAKAVWVVGGKKRGVMTAQAKWAFAAERDARRFIEENGGRVSSFDQAKRYAMQELQQQDAEERAVKRQILSGQK